MTSIKVQIPPPLRAECAGAKEVTVEATSVRGAIEALERSHPALHRGVCDDTGRVRPHVNLFVNSAHIRSREGLETALAQGDVVTILPAVSGG